MLTAATGTGPGLQASSSDVSAYSYNPSGNALGGPQAMGTMPNAHAAFGSQYLARVEEGMNNANLLGKTVTITGHLDPGTAVQHQGYDPCIVNADANIITGTEHLAFTVQADGSLVGTYTDDTTYTGDASKLPMPFQPDPGAPKKGQIVMLVPVAPMHAKTVLGNDSPMMFSGGNLNWCQAGLPDATQYCGA